MSKLNLNPMADWGYVNNSRFRFLSIRNQGGGKPVPPEPAKYIITAEDDGVASIIPEGEIEVNEGESITFNMGSEYGHPVINSIDGIKIYADGVSSYIFEDVNTNHSISINNSSVTVKYSIVTPHTYEGGSISPNSSTEIPLNKPVTFSIIPNEGYVIDKVLIDGHNVGAVSEYTFTFTEIEFHLIEAFFKEAEPATTYTVTSKGGGGVEGEIEPSGDTTVNAGESYTLTIFPNEGYVIDKVEDNYVNVTDQVDSNKYAIKNVNKDHIIVVSFKTK